MPKPPKKYLTDGTLHMERVRKKLREVYSQRKRATIEKVTIKDVDMNNRKRNCFVVSTEYVNIAKKIDQLILNDSAAVIKRTAMSTNFLF